MRGRRAWQQTLVVNFTKIMHVKACSCKSTWCVTLWAATRNCRSMPRIQNAVSASQQPHTVRGWLAGGSGRSRGQRPTAHPGSVPSATPRLQPRLPPQALVKVAYQQQDVQGLPSSAPSSAPCPPSRAFHISVPSACNVMPRRHPPS